MDEEVIEISDSEREENSSNSEMDVEITAEQPGVVGVDSTNDAAPEEIVPKDAATWVAKKKAQVHQLTVVVKLAANSFSWIYDSAVTLKL